jgi:hypothetical protein
MNFAEQLNAKKNLKVIEYANEFLTLIKEDLIKSAEEGYSGFNYKIDKNNESEKKKLQIYSDPLFTEHLNKSLEGVNVTYEKEYVENILLKGYGFTNHYLKFKW